MSTILDHFLTRSRTVIGISSLAVAATAMAGCGATTTGGSSSIPSLSVGGGTTPSASPGATSGQLGDTLVMEDAGDDVAHVTLLKVFDSATGFDPNTSPPDGTRWVGFEGTIVIDGSRSGEDSTSVDVIGSDGQTYGADTAYHLSTFDGCTATGIDVSPGQTQTFCAGVGLPPGVTVAKVGYSTEGVDGHAPAVLFWTVADSAVSTPTATPDDTTTPTPSPSASPTTTASPTPAATPTSTPTTP